MSRLKRHAVLRSMRASPVQLSGPSSTKSEVKVLHRVGPSDRELVERIGSGDRWAQEALYRRYVHRVTIVVSRLLRNGPDVEDVVQDTFLNGFRDLPTLQDPERVGGWLVRIAIHLVHKRFRRRRLRRFLGLESGHYDESLATQARVEASQEARAELSLLDRALDSLPTVLRICWVLRHLQEYRLHEVATLTGASLATVKRRLARAQTRLDRHFAEEGCDG